MEYPNGIRLHHLSVLIHFRFQVARNVLQLQEVGDFYHPVRTGLMRRANV